MSEKYLIFGATGSVGSNLSKLLKDSDYNIHLVARNNDEVAKLSDHLGCSYTVANVLEDGFVEKIKKFMTERILPMDDVEKRLAFKKEWNKKNKSGAVIPTEFNVQQWTEFLPPLTPVTVRRLNNISPTFERTLKTRMAEGSY